MHHVPAPALAVQPTVELAKRFSRQRIDPLLEETPALREGEAPDWERLVERREDFAMGVVPTGALVLTAGVDVQDDRLECDVWGWAEGFSSWLVDHIVISGSPRDRGPWDELAQVLARDWPRQGGGAMRIARLCVDTGGRDTAAVYDPTPSGCLAGAARLCRCAG